MPYNLAHLHLSYTKSLPRKCTELKRRPVTSCQDQRRSFDSVKTSWSGWCRHCKPKFLVFCLRGTWIVISFWRVWNLADSCPTRNLYPCKHEAPKSSKCISSSVVFPQTGSDRDRDPHLRNLGRSCSRNYNRVETSQGVHCPKRLLSLSKCKYSLPHAHAQPEKGQVRVGPFTKLRSWCLMNGTNSAWNDNWSMNPYASFHGMRVALVMLPQGLERWIFESQQVSRSLGGVGLCDV